MILNVILWYLAIALAGWLVFPLAYRVMAFLPDRGLALSRPLGLLLWGYAYWLLVSLGILQNDLGGVFFALLIVAGFSTWTLWREGVEPIRRWLEEQRSLVLAGEALFLVAFAAWAVVRAAIPEASGTEKPMELAFINAILRSPDFPPADPWLSGYAISYYYFGYTIVAVLARFTVTPGAVAFNLAVASWFALSALAAYGLVYNLLHLRGFRRVVGQSWALLAPFFLLIAGNFEGFLEMLHARGLFWRQAADGSWQSGFWQWLGLQELVNPPSPPFSFQPERPGGIWWWRASRVLQDFTLDGQPREVIDEFPMFSYLLGDLHPHVLAMPFAFLAAGLALNVYLSLRGGEGSLDLGRWVRRMDFWLPALALGGLAFLNTWDFPIYLALFSAAVALARLVRAGWSGQVALDFLGSFFLLGLAGGLLYLPFYLGFASQAGGLMPSLVFFTRGVHFWIMFGTLLLPVITWLAWKWGSLGNSSLLRQGAFFAVGLVAGLGLLSALAGIVQLSADPGLAGIWDGGDAAGLLAASLQRRLVSPVTWLTLLVLLTLTWGLLQAYRCRRRGEQQDRARDAAPSTEAQSDLAAPFALLLFLLGTGLALFPEFFYLRDQFGVRMNTIFKFYFQAWMLWALVAAYASAELWQALRGGWGWVYRVGWGVVVLLALPYAVFGLQSRTNGFNPGTWTLDGAAHLERFSPDELEAIRWLQTAPYGVVAEAVGGSYSGYARVSTHSGLPSVLGWPGHEVQWRGGASEMGSRQGDIERLFRARQWSQAREVLEAYNIRYVFIGSLERSEYRPDTGLFDQHLDVVFQNSGVTIYEVPRFTTHQGQVDPP